MTVWYIVTIIFAMNIHPYIGWPIAIFATLALMQKSNNG